MVNEIGYITTGCAAIAVYIRRCEETIKVAGNACWFATEEVHQIGNISLAGAGRPSSVGHVGIPGKILVGIYNL